MESIQPTDRLSQEPHQPVLLTEVLEWLKPGEGALIVDCTLGMGGHSEALLKENPTARVIGLDRDSESLELAQARLSEFGDRFLAVHSDYEDLSQVLEERGIIVVDCILADLGISSFQLEAPERGFSFLKDEPLDMRMDRLGGLTAADLVNDFGEKELADLIFEKGEERGSRGIARAIVKERTRQRIESTKQLADIVIRALHQRGKWRIHPATRTFQALRIAVNGEMERLNEFISTAISMLRIGGRLAIISFHSLEDRIVKNAYRRESGRCICEGREARPVSGNGSVVCLTCGAARRVAILTRKAIRPSEQEMDRNPRSRSARMRICERTHQ